MSGTGHKRSSVFIFKFIVSWSKCLAEYLHVPRTKILCTAFQHLILLIASKVIAPSLSVL